MTSSSPTWARNTTIRFCAVGHVTNDLLAAGTRPGGPPVYSALTAAYLGADATVVTSHGPDFAGGGLLEQAGVTVTAIPAMSTTSFVNEYGPSGRVQRVTALAAPLCGAVVPPADVVFYGPVVGELLGGSIPAAPAGALVGAGLQGWLRRIAGDGTVERTDLDVANLPRCDAVFVSIEDFSSATLIDRLRRAFPLVLLTEGAAGARLYSGGSVTRIAPVPTTEVDPTGAGDVFAAAFLLALRGGSSVQDAGARAAAAGALAVTAVGPGALVRPRV